MATGCAGLTVIWWLAFPAGARRFTHPARRGGDFSQVSEQRAKTFLLEMPVIGENLGDPALPHGLHRDAIGQTIAFIETHTVQI